MGCLLIWVLIMQVCSFCEKKKKKHQAVELWSMNYFVFILYVIRDQVIWKQTPRWRLSCQKFLVVGVLRNSVCESQGVTEQREEVTGKQTTQRPRQLHRELWG